MEGARSFLNCTSIRAGELHRLGILFQSPALKQEDNRGMYLLIDNVHGLSLPQMEMSLVIVQYYRLCFLLILSSVALTLLKSFVLPTRCSPCVFFFLP